MALIIDIKTKKTMKRPSKETGFMELLDTTMDLLRIGIIIGLLAFRFKLI